MKNQLIKEEQKAYLDGKKGEPVNFKYPEPPYLLKDKLLYRYVNFVLEDDWVVYWNMMRAHLDPLAVIGRFVKLCTLNQTVE
jgi:hypothetical protein